MPDYSLLATNLKAFEQNYPETFRELASAGEYETGESEVFFEKDRLGAWTLKVRDALGRPVYLHSPTDSRREAEQFIRKQSLVKGQNVVLFGLGLGYQLLEIIRNIGPRGHVTVFEASIPMVRAALKVMNLSEQINSKQIKMVITSDYAKFCGEFALSLDRLAENKGQLVLHGPSLRTLPSSLQMVREILQEWNVSQVQSETTLRLMDENFSANYNFAKRDMPVNVLIDKFKGWPLIIVAAGPSLDKNIDKLKGIAGKAIIMAVGTALGPLKKAGVIPDFVIITDPFPVVIRQLDSQPTNIPLIYLSTVNPSVVCRFTGPKFIGYQEGWLQSEAEAARLGIKTVETGGSVATTALDVAIRTGANPIIFVGQDLAYTGNKTHASNSMYDGQTAELSSCIRVTGNNGETVPTSISWRIYLKWMEKRIAREPECLFINATEGGAFIKGTMIISLAEVIERFIINREIADIGLDEL